MYSFSKINFGAPIGFFICFVFSFFLGTGDLIFPAIIFILVVAFYALLVSGIKGLFIVAIVGNPTLFVFGNNILQYVPAITMERLVFSFLLLLSTFYAIFSKHKRLPIDEIEKAGLLFLFILVLSLVSRFEGNSLSKFISDDVSFFLEGYFFPFISYSYAKRINWTNKDISLLMNLLLGVGVFLFFTSVLQMFLNIEWFIPTYTDVIHSESRATGTFSNASEFGSVTAVLFLLSMKQFLDSKNPIKSILLSIITVCIFIALILGKTRAPWLGLIVSMLIIFFIDIRSRKMLIFLFCLSGVVGIFIAPFYLTDELIWGRLFDMVPVYNRLSVWATAFNMMLSNPISGIGFGRYSFMENKVEYLTSFGNISASWAAELSVPHNEFIHLAALTGIVGIVFYFNLYRQIIIKLKIISLDYNLQEISRSYSAYILAILAGHLVNCFLVDTGKFAYINMLIFSLVGIATHLSDKNRLTHGAKKL